MHFKTELLTDEQMAKFSIKIGDTMLSEVPDKEGNLTEKKQVRVIDIEIAEAGHHPQTNVHLTRVTLQLT